MFRDMICGPNEELASLFPWKLNVIFLTSNFFRNHYIYGMIKLFAFSDTHK
jgi:hypothetical protein